VVVARPYSQHVAVCSVEPREDDDAITDVHALESGVHVRVDDEPRVWRAFVPLLGGRRPIRER
jgi:hypothetical protein